MSAQGTLFQYDDFPERAVSPMREFAAYESLWAQNGTTFKRIADLFAENPGALPSDLADPEDSLRMQSWLLEHFESSGIGKFGIRLHQTGEYPLKLRDAKYPVELLTYIGQWNWTEAPSVAVVGTRKPSREGVSRAQKLVRLLVDAGKLIVSGLADGIDTVAHTTALSLGAPTIAVIGTPLTHIYPKKNAELQKELGEKFCVISQIPAYRYEQQTFRTNRFFFPERNKTMSALTEATVIVEASETSGTLTQARAALHQGRKLFILDSCFRNSELTWPARFEEQGAIRVRDFEQIRDALTES